MENALFDATNLDFLALIKDIKNEAENLMPIAAAERGGVAMVDFLAHLLQVAKLSWRPDGCEMTATSKHFWLRLPIFLTATTRGKG